MTTALSLTPELLPIVLWGPDGRTMTLFLVFLRVALWLLGIGTVTMLGGALHMLLVIAVVPC